MVDGLGDIWDAFVAAAESIGPVVLGRSRYADKPALFLAGREIAHREAPGVVDLRITRAGWSRAEPSYRTDPAIRYDPARRDWIALELSAATDVDRLHGLLAIALAANA